MSENEVLVINLQPEQYVKVTLPDGSEQVLDGARLAKILGLVSAQNIVSFAGLATGYAIYADASGMISPEQETAFKGIIEVIRGLAEAVIGVPSEDATGASLGATAVIMPPDEHIH